MSRSAMSCSIAILRGRLPKITTVGSLSQALSVTRRGLLTQSYARGPAEVQNERRSQCDLHVHIADTVYSRRYSSPRLESILPVSLIIMETEQRELPSVHFLFNITVLSKCTWHF